MLRSVLDAADRVPARQRGGGGIALINSVGNIGGFVGPYVVGFVKDRTGRFEVGLLVLAGVLTVGGCLALTVRGPNEARVGARGRDEFQNLRSQDGKK